MSLLYAVKVGRWVRSRKRVSHPRASLVNAFTWRHLAAHYKGPAARSTAVALTTANMDIAALVNPVSEAPPRRSPSISHHALAPSPATASATLATPPLSTHNTTMSRKRKRHDEKPIWAVREDEVHHGQTLQMHISHHLQSRPRPSPQAQAPPEPTRNGPPPNHAPLPAKPESAWELTGYERPISDDAHVYDEVARTVCDFLWPRVVTNDMVRKAMAESPGTQVEVEARWGQILERDSGQRLRGIHTTECVVNTDVSEGYKFESTMTMEQHKRMNNYLNNQVQKSRAPNARRARIDYKHTKEIDQFFELDQEGFNRLPQLTKQLIAQSGTRQRIRVTQDAKEGAGAPRAIIKHRIANLEISSPRTEWDYRIGINLEIQYPGPVNQLKPVVEPGKSVEGMKRHKDRVSYAWGGAFQVDLTQVSQDGRKNHELELELDSQVLMENADNNLHDRSNQFENLITGMMNNLRVLSREITPAGPGV